MPHELLFKVNNYDRTMFGTNNETRLDTLNDSRGNIMLKRHLIRGKEVRP